MYSPSEVKDYLKWFIILCVTIFSQRPAGATRQGNWFEFSFVDEKWSHPLLFVYKLPSSHLIPPPEWMLYLNADDYHWPICHPVHSREQLAKFSVEKKPLFLWSMFLMNRAMSSGLGDCEQNSLRWEPGMETLAIEKQTKNIFSMCLCIIGSVGSSEGLNLCLSIRIIDMVSKALLVQIFKLLSPHSLQTLSSLNFMGRRSPKFFVLFPD